MNLKTNFFKYSKYIKNSGWLLLEKAVRFIIGFTISVLVVRYLGPKDYGLYSYLQSIIAILGVFVTLGLDGIVLKEISKNEKELVKIFSISLILRFLVSFIIIVGLYFYWLFYKSEDSFLLFIMGFIFVFESFSIFKVYFQYKILSKYEVIANLIALFFSSILKLLFIYYQLSLIYLIVIVIFDKAVYAITIFRFYKRFEEFKLVFDKEKAKYLLYLSWPLIFSTLSYIVYTKTDQIMIKHMIGDYEVGIYSVAVTLYNLPFILTTILSSTITPVLYKKFHQSKDEYFNLTLKVLSYTTLFAYILVAIYVFFGKEIILFLYGEKYIESYQILIILAFIIIVMFNSFLRSGYFILVNFQRTFMYINLFYTFLNIVLNYFFILRFGLMGAVYATFGVRMISWIFFAFFKEVRNYWIVQLQALFLKGII